MKKILALLLALCMMLAAVPVWAEDVSGTWYLVMMGITSGTFDLKADGTCSLMVQDNGDEQNLEGTWTQDGDKITIEADGNALPLTYDGTNLQLDPEGIAALGLDASLGDSGMDTSILSSFFQISREPGKITAAELSAYQEDGTLPEGKTEEDMQAIQAEMLGAILLMMGSTGDVGSYGEGAALELTVLEDNFFVREGYGEQEGVYIAKVQNNHDEPAYLTEVSLILQDADGNEAGRSEYPSYTGSRYLEPGEVSFVSIVAYVNEGMTVEGYTVDLQASAATYQTPDTSLEVSDVELRVKEDYYMTNYYAAAAVTNQTDAPMAYVSAVLAVRASDGKLYDLTSSGLYQNELAAGSTVILVENIDSRTLEYCANNSLTLDQVEAYAWMDTY